MQTDINMWK